MGKCNIEKCKASCCYWVPLSPKFVEKHKDKIVNHYVASIPFKEGLVEDLRYYIIQVDIEEGKESCSIHTEKQPCPFLNTKTYKCNVYEDRPNICRKFGSSTKPINILTCAYHLGYDFNAIQDTPEDWQSNTHFEDIKDAWDSDYGKDLNL